MFKVYHPGAQWLINNGNLPEKVRCIDLMDVVKYVNGVLYHQPFMLLHEMTHAYQHRVYYDHGRLIRIGGFLFTQKISTNYQTSTI